MPKVKLIDLKATAQELNAKSVLRDQLDTEIEALSSQLEDCVEKLQRELNYWASDFPYIDVDEDGELYFSTWSWCDEQTSRETEKEFGVKNRVKLREGGCPSIIIEPEELIAFIERRKKEPEHA